MLFTTSWDDGYILDRRVGDLLSKYGLKGTFYACPAGQYGLPMLTADDLQTLAITHEIGAHTLTHPRLTRVSPALALEEIAGSKRWVEDMTGRPCRMFCYPKGDWNQTIAALVREAGFAGARTTEPWRFNATDPFALPTTLQAREFPLRRHYKSLRHIIDPLGPMRVAWRPLRKLGVPVSAFRGWLPLAIHLFETALIADQPVFHLWGHSSELERYAMWDELEAFLSAVQRSGAVKPITNGQLADRTRKPL